MNKNGEQKIEFDDFIMRASVEDGVAKVFIHRKNKQGNEELPLGYILGSNCAYMKAKVR